MRGIQMNLHMLAYDVKTVNGAAWDRCNEESNWGGIPFYWTCSARLERVPR